MPKVRSVISIFEEIGAALREDGRTRLQAVIDGIYADAEAGNMEARKYICDRLAGRPAQAIQHSGPEGGAIPLAIATEDAARIATAIERMTARE